jgi:TPP-dependent indolepyruvate ferredoxin oxidoreductase alpha subunit
MDLLESVLNEVITEEEVEAMRFAVSKNVEHLEEARKEFRKDKKKFDELKRQHDQTHGNHQDHDPLECLAIILAGMKMVSVEEGLKKAEECILQMSSLLQKVERIYANGKRQSPDTEPEE